jgi:UDP-N-acetylmuramoyl-tripeptide--D-alanyl-D-alanine ligase
VEPWSLQHIATACDGELMTGPPGKVVRRVGTDSRNAQPEDLFVAVAGERFDGHTFLSEVASKRVASVLIERAKLSFAAGLPPHIGVIAVENTRAALGRFAARYRADFDLPVIAVCGSNGKTTTKELIAAVLRQVGPTLWSEASFNNDIGVPLTLLRLERSHQAAVLEAGTNHPGELAPLVRMIQPRFGVLTNIGREHLEFFGSLEGVAQEEGALAEALPSSGRLFLGGDSEWTPAIARRSRASSVTVGFGEHNDWRARRVWVNEIGAGFEVAAPRSEFSGEYQLRLLGRHQVTNALLALAAGTELGATPEQARRGLVECAPPKMRLEVWEAHGVRVLDDAYNANADSMLAALQTLADFPFAGRRVAVLGDMAELGGHTAAAHREVGRRAAELLLNTLVAVGQWARETAQSARDAGLRETHEFANVAVAAAALKSLLQPGDVVLLKASRATGFERLGAALRTDAVGAPTSNPAGQEG